MVPLQKFVKDVLAEAIRRQPPSPARTSFAWQVAVGPTLARVTTVELVKETLIVCARDPQWAVEITRASALILARMQELLGREVREIEVRNP